MNKDDQVIAIVKSILTTTSIELFGEPETDFIKLMKKAEEEGKENALLKLILFEIDHNFEEHK